MFEKEIQFITDFNLNKIKSLGASFIFDELFRAELHPALIRFISGKLDYLMYEERKILLENSRFDYSGVKITEYFNRISEEIKKTKKLSYKETEDFIKKGVIFNANFSVQPKTTLTSLIFKDGNEPKRTSEIKIYLNFIYYYDYFKEIINSYISKKKIAEIGKADFREILEKIDCELLNSKKEEIISDALYSIADFYNDGGIIKSSLQPPLVEAFLKEKDFEEMISLLHNGIKDYKKKIGVEEFKKILFTKAPVKKEQPEEKVMEAAEEETKPVEETITDNSLQEDSKVIDEELIEEEIDENENTLAEKEDEKRVEKKIDSKSSLPDEDDTLVIDEIEEKEIQEPIFEEEIVDIEDKGAEIDDDEIIEEDIPAEKKKRKKDIFSFLSHKEIEKIVSMIFNDDEDDFTNTMENISECNNYEKASEILKSIFFSNQVNPYKREAVSLTNAVANYFHQGN